MLFRNVLDRIVRFKYWLKVVMVNFILLLIIDYIFGVLMPEIPTYYPSKGYYSSNYRGYFIPGMLKDGTTVYYIPFSGSDSQDRETQSISRSDFKVFAFGDSFTEGQGVDANDAWPRQLENLFSGTNIRVTNYGVSGTSVVEIANKINENVHKANRPDLVVYAFVLNDPIYDPVGEAVFLDSDTKNNYGIDCGLYHDFILWRTKVFDNNRPWYLQKIYRYSHTARYFISRYEVSMVTAKTKRFYQNVYNPKINPNGLKQTFELIEQMNQRVSGNSGKFLVMIFPLFYQLRGDYPFYTQHQFISEELTKRGIEVLDLYPIFKKYKDSDLWVHPSDLHPNDLAHRLTAKGLKYWIEKNMEK